MQTAARSVVSGARGLTGSEIERWGEVSRCDRAPIPRCVYYDASRTSHGSTLSRVVDSRVTARPDGERARRLFQEALDLAAGDAHEFRISPPGN